MKYGITGKRRCTTTLAKINFYGKKEGGCVDGFFSFLIAFSLILQHYKGFLGNAGISVLVLGLPYIVLGLLAKLQNEKISVEKIIFPLVLFSLYKAFIHEVNFMGIAQAIVIVIYYFAISEGVINLKSVFKSASRIAQVASILIIVQYVCHYIFGFHLKLVPVSLLLPESSQWIAGAETGQVGINGIRSELYRPSAFFLEPSHMFLYVFPILFVFLLSPNIDNWRRKIAILLTVGLFLTTSGMGIGVSCFAWILYLGFNSGKLNNIKLKNVFRIKNLIMLITFCIVFIVLCFTVPFFRDSIVRIFVGESGGSNAIEGRTAQGFNLIANLTGVKLLIGVTSTTVGIQFNMAGFVATLYKFGIIGTFLSYAFYVKNAICQKVPYKWIAVVIVFVSFFSAHTHGIFYMLYYVIILMMGYNEKFTTGGKIRWKQM